MDEQKMLTRNHNRVVLLYEAIKSGGAGLKQIPQLLHQILTKEMWKSHINHKTGEIHKFEKFEDFVVAHVSEGGLFSTVAQVESLCEGTETKNLLDQELKRGPGKLWDSRTTKNTVNNIDSIPRPRGTSQRAGLRRLRAEIAKAETPEKAKRIKTLQQAVFNNEISIHKALIKIGARKETITIPLDPEKAAKAIVKKFNKDQIAELVTLLRETK